MSLRAETYRQRTQAVRRQYAAGGVATVAMATVIARSYEALARNEEWLEGEVSPSEACIQHAR